MKETLACMSPGQEAKYERGACGNGEGKGRLPWLFF